MKMSLKDFNPEPYVCQAGEVFYKAIAADGHCGIEVYCSRDSKEWQLTSELSLQSDEILAPQLSCHAGKFWLVYSDVKVDADIHNYLIIGDAVGGDWDEPILLNSSGFGPFMFHDEDGAQYVLWHIWDDGRYCGVALQQYSHYRNRLVIEPKIIFKGNGDKFVLPQLQKVGENYHLCVAEGIAVSSSIDGQYTVNN
ncbi:MAG: family 43 glycosylhydrolase [Defluviitaleaceae bacterium]|nr:family 43 glycosylhydrolase [Defluviitaleaceae bacterium]